MDRRAFLRATAVGSSATVAGCSWLSPTDSDGDGPPRLSVDGRWLTDPAGNRVVLRGVNVVDPWWGVEYADLRGKDYWETLAQATDPDQGWHAHVVRFPIEGRTVDTIGYEQLMDEYLDRAVELTREAGVYAIIDFHAITRYDTVDIDRRIREFWGAVAPRYAEESHVLFELFNEPTQPAGEGLATWRNWRSVAQPWVDYVRERAPKTPIIVGSPSWSSLTRFAPVAPFDDDNVVYAGHVFPSWEQPSWEATFGSPALTVPVFISEWGYVNVRDERTEPHMIGSTSGWGEPFREWLDRHRNVHWCAWTFDSEWVPPMFDHEWNLLGGEDYMGAFAKRWLAETRTEYWPPGRESSTPTPGANRSPSAPMALRVVDRGPSAIEIAWDPATDPDGDAVAQYRVAVDGETVQTRSGSATGTTIGDLEPDTEYTVAVVAIDDGGARSVEPATVTASTRSATEPVATISRVDSAPTLDGTLGSPWDGVAGHAVENVLIPPPDDADELAGTWRAVWDADALYYHVAVTDPEAHTDSDAEYQDDNVEVYLDPDYSRESSYDGEDDAQLLVRRGEDRVVPGANSVTDWTNVAVAQRETDDGWAIELAIPWTDTGVTPEAGMRLGTDVHVTDDVDGGDRDAKLGWFSTTDASWQRPDTFATVVLGE